MFGDISIGKAASLKTISQKVKECFGLNNIFLYICTLIAR
jgi:hypothetical protein